MACNVIKTNKEVVMEKKNVMVLLMGICLAVVMVGYASLTASAPNPEEKKVIELKYSHIFPPQPSLPAQIVGHFAKLIEEKTGGRVKVTIYPAGALVAPAQIFDGALKGLTDIGSTTHDYVPGRFPALTSTGCAYATVNAYAHTRAAYDIVQKFNPKEVADLVVFFPGSPGPYVIASRVGVILKPEDLKGRTIRSMGGLHVDWCKSVGASPVFMPSTEIYEALSKGVLDTALVPMEMAKGFKMYEVARNWTVAPYTPWGTHWHFMGLERWRTLPKDIQDKISEAAEEMREWSGRTWLMAHIDGMAYATAHGGKVTEIPKTDWPAWEKYAGPLEASYTKMAEAKGLPADEYLKYFRERIKYWEGKSPDEKALREWAAKELVMK